MTTFPARLRASPRIPVEEMREWLRSRQGVVPRIALPLFAGYALGMLLAQGGPAHAFVSELYNVVVPLLATVAAWWASRHPSLDQRTRQVWLAHGVGTLALAIGCAIWLVDDYVIGQRPAVSMADLMYLTYYPILLWGFLRFPTARLVRSDRPKLWLDVGAVVVVCGEVIWYLVLGPAVNAASSTPLAIFLSTAYPIGDLVLLFAVVRVLLHRPAAKSSGAVQLLMLSQVAMFASDLVLGYRVVHTGAYLPGTASDLGWQSAMLLWLLAGCYQRWRAALPDAEPRLNQDTPLVISVIPYVAVVIGYGLLVYVVRPHWGTPRSGVVGATVLLTLLVLTRQLLAVRENVHLLAERMTQEARFRSLVQNSSDVITIIDEQGVIRFMTPAVLRVLGWTPEEAVGKHITEIVHRDDAATLATFIAELPSSSAGDAYDAASPIIVLRCRNRSGEWRYVETVATSLLDDPAVRGVVLNTRDVSERVALQAQLTHQAYHDPLTQLANRAWFHAQVEQALLRSTQAPEHVAVFFLDIDNFKNVNDSLGHAEGDRMLVEVASRLLNATRGSDTVARLGGDEFSVLVTRVTTDADLTVIANRIESAMRMPFRLTHGEIFSGASIGIARGAAGDSVDDVLRNADVAMYVSKRQGKGGYTVFEPKMHAQARERLGLETDLRHALTHGELALVFQPFVSLTDTTLVGVEALVRWRHPERGLLMPREFIPLAEESGLILPLGRWVLMEACRHGVRWRRMLPEDTPFTVSVNVSGRQLQQAAFLDDVSAALQETGLPPRDLLLEITESVIVRDTSVTLQRLNVLKALGVRLAIDDFGTGYSSLSFLQQFPLDVLKIDKSFVDETTNTGSGPALARTIVSLSKMLSLQTVAEGVEHQRQADALNAMGCGIAQGFHFSRPVGSDVIDALVQHRRTLGRA